jgi:hypothetical protein
MRWVLAFHKRDNFAGRSLITSSTGFGRVMGPLQDELLKLLINLRNKNNITVKNMTYKTLKTTEDTEK